MIYLYLFTHHLANTPNDLMFNSTLVQLMDLHLPSQMIFTEDLAVWAVATWIHFVV